MKKLIIICLISCFSIRSITCFEYKQFYISKYCQVDSRHQTIELEDEDDSAIMIKSGLNYRNFMDCALIVEPEKGMGITVTIRKVNLRKTVDKLTISIDNSKDLEWTGSKVMDNKESVSYNANKKVKISFSTQYSSESTKYKEFIVILTAYRKSSYCKESEISCGPKQCISSNFLCDGHNNCGDNSDEILCLDGQQTSNLAIIGSGLAGLVVLLLFCYCCRCCFCCCSGSKKKRTDYIDSDGIDQLDYHKIETTFNEGSSEPSAPINSHDYVNYGTAPNSSVRFPVNPNYPYFIDDPNYPRGQSSNTLHSHFMPPPPPYTPRDPN